MPKKTTIKGRIYWESRDKAGRWLGRSRYKAVAENLERIANEQLPAKPAKYS